MRIKNFKTFKKGYNKIVEKSVIDEHNELVDKINSKLEKDPKFIFDSLNKEMPSEKDGEDYENLFDEAREEAIMFFKQKPQLFNENVTIDISGPDGNAFALIGYARKFAKQLDLDFKPIQQEMMSGDYENLLDVFNKYFGNVVDLVGYDDEDEYFEESEKVGVRLFPEQIKWIKDNVLPEDDLDLAMMDLQEVIVKTDDGGVCGMYFSEYDDADEHWASSDENQRMKDVMAYLELEGFYKDLNKEDK